MEGSYIEGKRVIVTGGAGVIGCELLKLLGEKGATVLSVDRCPLPKRNWQGVRQVQKDLATDNMDELREFQPQIIFHLAAAFERSEESAKFWDTNWHDNILLSHRIIDLATEIPDLAVFVFASSYLVYSSSLYLSPSLRDDAVRLKEEDPIAPRNLCGAAKYYTERESEFVKEVLNPSLRAIYARIFRVYGCGSKDVISRWIRAGLRQERIEVFGRENRFDYIFAGDVAEGLMKLAEANNARGPVNLGTGTSRKIDDVIRIIQREIPHIQIDGVEKKNMEFEASSADISLLGHITGWHPPTSLEDGIKRVIDFERDQPR